MAGRRQTDCRHVRPDGREPRRRAGRRSDQDRPCRGPVRRVRAIRRGDHPRARGRDRRDQRQGRPARRPQARAGAARRRIGPAQGHDGGTRADLPREGRGGIRRHRHAGRHGDGAGLQQGEDDPHGRVGRRNRHHAQRRDAELRVPRLGGRRAGGRQAARLRQQEVRRQESRADADQQSVGPVERAGPDRGRKGRTRRSRSSASKSSRTPTSTWCRS